jgi:hypothetical protein
MDPIQELEQLRKILEYSRKGWAMQGDAFEGPELYKPPPPPDPGPLPRGKPPYPVQLKGPTPEQIEAIRQTYRSATPNIESIPGAQTPTNQRIEYWRIPEGEGNPMNQRNKLPGALRMPEPNIPGQSLEGRPQVSPPPRGIPDALVQDPKGMYRPWPEMEAGGPGYKEIPMLLRSLQMVLSKTGPALLPALLSLGGSSDPNIMRWREAQTEQTNPDQARSTPDILMELQRLKQGGLQ